MRTILNTIPDTYINTPKESFELPEESYREIEAILQKIAEEHSIQNVSNVSLAITNSDCIIKYSCDEQKPLNTLKKEEEEKEEKE